MYGYVQNCFLFKYVCKLSFFCNVQQEFRKPLQKTLLPKDFDTIFFCIPVSKYKIIIINISFSDVFYCVLFFIINAECEPLQFSRRNNKNEQPDLIV